MTAFKTSILAVSNAFFEGECESIVVPMLEGQYGILAHHCNMIGAVVTGALYYRVKGEETKKAFVTEGLIKVENNEVLVIVGSAEKPEEVEINRAKNAADEEKEAILQKKSIHEYRAAQANLSRIIASIRGKSNYDGTPHK